MKNSTKFGLLLTIGIILLIAGFSTDGLWPWQLPACAIGGFLVTYSFNFYEKRN